MTVPIIEGFDHAGGNDSEYAIDPAKWRTRPWWLEECDGYRDRATQTDDQSVRCYRCPWSKRQRAREWLLGYTLPEIHPDAPQADVDAANQWFARAINDDGAVFFRPTPVVRLVREPPAPDPERPWLFAAEVETARGEGAWVESPTGYVGRDADGVTLLPDPHNPEEPWRHEAIAYVDNSLGGNFGSAPRPGEGFGVVDVPPSNKFRVGTALLRVTYRPRNYVVLSDDRLGDRTELARYVERREDYGLEAIPLSRLAQAQIRLKFAEGPYADRDVFEAGMHTNPTATLFYIWHEVPDLPRSSYYHCLGRVNSRPFDGLNGMPTYEPQTLLCMPWKVERYTGVTGRICHRVQYRLMFRPKTWNKFPAANGIFYRVTWGGKIDGETVYREADFNLLFMPPPPVRYIS